MSVCLPGLFVCLSVFMSSLFGLFGLVSSGLVCLSGLYVCLVWSVCISRMYVCLSVYLSSLSVFLYFRQYYLVLSVGHVNIQLVLNIAPAL